VENIEKDLGAEVQGNDKGEISVALGKDESPMAILNTNPEE